MASMLMFISICQSSTKISTLYFSMALSIRYNKIRIFILHCWMKSNTRCELILRWNQDRSVISPEYTLAHRKISSTQMKLRTWETSDVADLYVAFVGLVYAISSRVSIRTKSVLKFGKQNFYSRKNTLLWVVWPEIRWLDEHIRYWKSEKERKIQNFNAR